MRNLKKFLALVMAMVMSFSLMLTVNAANPVKTFDDADQITEAFVEAADVLTGMKVFQGDERGFAPAATITRAEVAALIYRLATGDVDNVRAGLYANYGNFADVNESDWFAGYVGYCANAGYIKGTTPTTFNPYGQVTGYEVLAMILRAIGYDKNNEFVGATWQTNVSALATQLGILENIKTTHYGDTLHLASRRDVVAELLFQADAFVPMVTYTTAFGYQNTGMEGGVVGSKTNPTLGLRIFGLTNSTGIIVGNQETGERVTILGRAGEVEYTGISAANTLQPGMKATWTAYNYPGTPVVDGTSVAINGTAGATGTNDLTVNNSLFLKFTSGIDVFGHNTKFWYNGGENDGTKQGTRDNPRTVYASFDKVKSEKIVYAANDDLADADGVEAVSGENHPALNTAVKGADMVLNSANSAIFNTAFDRMTRSHKTAGSNGYGTTGTDSPNSLYKLISNTTNVNGENVLDLVIELNIQSSKVNAVDNVSNIKYVGVVDVDTTGYNYLPDDNIRTATETGYIAQAALVGDSVKTLGAYEIGWHVTGTWSEGTVTNGGRRSVTGTATEDAALAAITNGTAADLSHAYFMLGAVATKEGVVSSYHNHTADVPGTGWVILSDGTKLNQSVLYNTVQTSATSTSIPQQNGTINTANTQQYGSMTYRFYLDAEGNYVGAEPIVGTEFVYGTYIDFESNLGTSTYTYRLVGVNMNGEMVTKDVKKYGTGAFNGTMTNIGAAGAELDKIGVPFRGDSSYTTTSVTGVQPGLYTGYAVNSVGNMTSDTDNTSGTNLPIPMFTDNNATYEIFDGTVTINKTDTAIGAVKAGDDANADGTDNDPIYFTEATKFVLVKGTGTDTQKVKVYNGISELLGANRTVTINFAGDPTASYFETAGTEEYRDMTVFSQSNYVYAQNATGTSKQADVIFIPEEAVNGVGSSLYYVGNATPLLVNAYGEDATKFAMYVDGERAEYWIKGLVDDTQVAGTARTSATIVAFGATAGTDTIPDNHDQFYNLTDTGLKATDGQPIYTVTAVTASYNGTTYRAQDGIVIAKDYVAATTDSQTAMIYTAISATPSNGALYNVGTAKVVNLNAQNTGAARVWPNITDLATLNEASSLNNVNSYREVQVSAVLSGDNLTAEVIYVCYNQSHT